MTTAMYAGTFDPITHGHVDIVERAAKIYDEIVVSIAHSRSALFSTKERVDLAQRVLEGIPNVTVTTHSGLTVDAAREKGAQVLVRGLRAITDFTYEFDMALMNRKMAPEIESAFLMTSLDLLYVSASRVRELSSFGRDVGDLVDPIVTAALSEKFPEN
ncbi:MAG: pantetheine-phosphate adenylyltransferase [Dehalococcoidia bacterium]|jgi:pantetheine-phosphate adenylyltransferase|nr:pantetheine-phosphate adenylyltransferase [Dehalococcoidia bacterium]